jgi:hypothetical protein
MFGIRISEAQIKVVNHFLSIKQFFLKVLSLWEEKAQISNCFKRMCVYPTLSGELPTMKWCFLAWGAEMQQEIPKGHPKKVPLGGVT